MKIYIAALFNMTRGRGGQHNRIIGLAKPPWVLESYHYLNHEKATTIRAEGRKIFLDSGAYSMFTKGVEVDLKEYARFIYRHRDTIDVAANLDAIGVADGAQQSYNNLKQMEGWLKPQGIGVLPVHHVRDRDEWLQRYLGEGYDYICLGGMVPESTPHLRAWLDHIWGKYLTDSEGKPKVRVHGFGLTTLELMFRYPWHSVDSTSWIMSAMFGGVLMDFPPGFPGGPPRDFKVDFSAQSSKQKDLNSWHYTCLDNFNRRNIDARLAELEAARPKQPELEAWLEGLGYKPGYNPAALAHSYGWRAHMNIDYFNRIQSRRVDRFVATQNTLF